MIRTSSMTNLLNDDDWRLTYTEPGTQRKRWKMSLAPENFASISQMSNDKARIVRFTHFNIYRRIWEYLILFASAFPLFEIPLVAIFKPDIHFAIYSITFVFDVLYIVDMYVVTHTSYLSHGVFNSDESKIFKRYGRLAFVLHIIGCVPIGWVGVLVKRRYVFLVLSLNKLMRLRRTINAVETIQRSLAYSDWASSMIPLFLLLAFFIHFFAIMFYLCARFQAIEKTWIYILGWENLSPPQLYIVSIYFVMTTILTIGYGDITPKTTPETILVIFIQLIGVMINAYIVSTLVKILIDPVGNAFIEKFAGFVNFMKFKNVPKDLQHDIKDYLQLKWQRNHGTEDPENVYRYIPETIRDKMKRDICSKCFSKVSFLKMGSERLFVAISNLIRDISYVPGETIMQQGETTCEMLLLISGSIEIMADQCTIAKSSCDEGIVIGEQELFVDIAKISTVKALTYVEGWSITRGALIHCIAHRPELRKELLDNAMIVFPSKYKDIKKLLSGRNMKAELERKKQLQQQMIKKILEINKNEESLASTESSESDNGI